jgi:hypothetical protein
VGYSYQELEYPGKEKYFVQVAICHVGEGTDSGRCYASRRLNEAPSMKWTRKDDENMWGITDYVQIRHS